MGKTNREEGQCPADTGVRSETTVDTLKDIGVASELSKNLSQE